MFLLKPKSISTPKGNNYSIVKTYESIEIFIN